MPLKTKAILTVAALAFIALLVIFGEEPSLPTVERDTCPSMGIDPETMREGTCYVGDSKTVVVDRGHRLKLETLDARLLGVRQGTTLTGPGGTRGAKGVFLTFDLAITNRTDAPARVARTSSPSGPKAPTARTSKPRRRTNRTRSSPGASRSPRAGRRGGPWSSRSPRARRR